jgi:hypothetical protein
MLVSSTVAPGIADPVESITVPTTSPVVDCAGARGTNRLLAAIAPRSTIVRRKYFELERGKEKTALSKPVVVLPDNSRNRFGFMCFPSSSLNRSSSAFAHG